MGEDFFGDAGAVVAYADHQRPAHRPLRVRRPPGPIRRAVAGTAGRSAVRLGPGRSARPAGGADGRAARPAARVVARHVFGTHRDPHRRAAVLEGVADQVRQDDVQPPRVQPGHGAAVRVQLDGVQPGPCVDTGGHLVRDVDLVQHQPGRPRVEAGDLHQVLHEVVQPPGLADHQLHRRRDHRVEGVRLLLQHLGDRGDRGQRRPQLVRHIGDEPPGRRLAPAQLLDPLLQTLRRAVERPGEIGEFIRAGHPQPGVQTPLAELSRRMSQPLYGPQHRRRRGLRQQRRADQRERGRDAQRPGQRVEVLPLGGQRLHHVAGGPAADHLRPGDEIGTVPDLLALPVEMVRVAVGIVDRAHLVDRAAQRRRHVLERQQVLVRGGRAVLAVAVHADQQHRVVLWPARHLPCRVLEFGAPRTQRQRPRTVLQRLAEILEDGVLGAVQNGVAVEPVRDAGRGDRRGQRHQREDHDQPQPQTGPAQQPRRAPQHPQHPPAGRARPAAPSPATGAVIRRRAARGTLPHCGESSR